MVNIQSKDIDKNKSGEGGFKRLRAKNERFENEG
jgi:hypothetical protein